MLAQWWGHKVAGGSKPNASTGYFDSSLDLIIGYVRWNLRRKTAKSGIVWVANPEQAAELAEAFMRFAFSENATYG
jgi:hypothetical protein